MFSVLSFTRPGERTLVPGFHLRTPFSVVETPGPVPELFEVSSPRTLSETASQHGHAVVGALSFDCSRAALAAAPDLSVTHGSPGLRVVREEPWPRLVGDAVLHPTPEGYREGVRQVLRAIAEERVVKTVLGRTVQYRFDAPVPAESLTRALARRHPEARTYCCPLPGGDSLVGASPELLVSRHGTTVRSHPLAGSVPRSANPAQDEAAARQLLASTKDLREHAVVVEMIADTLAPYCTRLTVPNQPALVSTRTVWHLGTWLRGELRDPQTSSLELAAALQPTPALCGAPHQPALDLLRGVEGFDREWFGGAVGWNDEHGDGEWTVAIRCARLSGTTATLFAGAGLVAGSDPSAELAETSAKFAALQDVLLGCAGQEHQERIA
ncbi:isochorismate synthase [Luteococcus japonicus]|uniref:isochorismate synthase n=1 Tax=Luteococcus japonicus LSP_Lj1 TaxID=1255658 RepID=A0A1R4KG59_9ACTN|nr:isochorismate synthase [Luteococcus japonicus]SJN43269.1 Isochorismate synthase of siderophore biosynthesis [Luteococcus japonicus LSP_Lj1]